MVSSTEDSDSNSSDKSDRQPLSNIEIDFSLEVSSFYTSFAFLLLCSTCTIVYLIFAFQRVENLHNINDT
jgi:hypothetical protein